MLNIITEEDKGIFQYKKTYESFPEKYKEIINKDKYYIKEIEEKQEKLKNINAFLAQYSDGNNTMDVKKIENERSKANEEIISLEKRKALNESDISRFQNSLADKKSELERIEEKRKSKDTFDKQAEVFKKLNTNFEFVQNEIMDEIKTIIQSLTWKRFNAMIWKKNTFGNITINDKYDLSVYNNNNKQMTGSLGATEYMALAYSFTLAIHEASGKNCPLVVDSPLGRVSDSNRINMANVLLEVSKNKQIIMLFTPDEYSTEVKDIFDDKASSVRDISLSENEEQIEKVGDKNG